MNNSNPVNVTNRVMKRLSMDGSVLPIPQTKDKVYLYTLNPSPIHHRSNKIDHALKIVDFYIQYGTPKQFAIEPTLGTYQPDIMYRDKNNHSICVEIQLTQISVKKMQQKINQFVHEYRKEHDSKILLLCSNANYNGLKIPNGFQLIRKNLPQNILL
jgi:hypothetical protein